MPAGALDKAHRAAAPRVIGGAEHVGVGHAGHAEQLLANLGRIDVLAAGNEHVVGAFLHEQQPVFVERRRVASQEKAVGGIGRPRIQVPAEQPRPAHGQAPEPVGPRIDDAGNIAAHQAHSAGKARLNQGIGYLAGGFGHAVAGEHPRMRLQRAPERAGVQRPATEQDARIAAKLHRVRGVEHVLQHLVHHRNVRDALLRGVGEHAIGVEAAVENEGAGIHNGAHHHLQAAYVVHRQAHLPHV